MEISELVIYLTRNWVSNIGAEITAGQCSYMGRLLWTHGKHQTNQGSLFWFSFFTNLSWHLFFQIERAWINLEQANKIGHKYVKLHYVYMLKHAVHSFVRFIIYWTASKYVSQMYAILYYICNNVKNPNSKWNLYEKFMNEHHAIIGTQKLPYECWLWW